MRLYKFSAIPLILSLVALLAACEEDSSKIGSSISRGEVEITVDTFYFDLGAKAVALQNFDAKTGNLMIGKIQEEGYGTLDCSFLTRLMCAPTLDVPDSLLFAERVDSVKLIMGAQRSEITGDSLAPQRMAIYRLTKQLPNSLTNAFNPEGYYDPQTPLASKSYTVSAIAEKDSAFYNNSFVELSVDLPKEFGMQVFEQYRKDPQTFAWPQTMAERFLPGLYVKSTFGNGCIANINTVYVGIFYHSIGTTTNIEDEDTTVIVKHYPAVTFPFTVSPEVLSSNRIAYTPSAAIKEKNDKNDGQVIITTPGGYITNFEFPAQTMIDRYLEKNVHLSTVNDLFLYIPAEVYDSKKGVTLAQNLLMIKSSEYEEFFEKNKIPDNISSFTGVYDSVNNRYYFASLREYFLELLKKDTIEKEDLEFTLIPVTIETETVSNYYGEGATYVTKCLPLTSKPTMTLLKMNEAMVTFSFSTQLID